MTLVQPSEELRGRRLDPRRLDAAGLAELRAELHTRYLPTVELDCQGGDQLTCELQDFVHCVRTAERPRAAGVDGLDALALATRVLDRLEAHAWDGPVGRERLALPSGALSPAARGGAAA